MQRCCRNCNHMIGLINKNKTCRCRIIYSANGVAEMLVRLVPYQDEGCGCWAPYREAGPFKHPETLSTFSES